MSAIFGETLTFQQYDGEPIKLVVFGDDMYARYETPDGYTVIFDDSAGGHCYADVSEGRLTSTGIRVSKPPPAGLERHLHEPKDVRNDAVRGHLEGMLPIDASPFELEAMLTFGPQGGLLPGRVLNTGDVRGLTILVTFADTPTTVTQQDVQDLLNGSNFRANGNASSVHEYFQTMSTGRLRFTNKVVGPYQLSRPKLTYANIEGILVPEAIQLAIDDGIDFAEFDSLGQGVVDSLCIMYAGQTEYRGDLWPHNWVHRKSHGGVRTELYIVTSMGRRPADLSIGTFCHETGHMLFRWPDLYDYGLAEREGDDFKSSGVGTYCVMGAGNHLDRGRTPAPVSVYLRDLVGWCGNQVDLNGNGQFEATHGDYDTALRWSTDVENEYFLIENRAQLGFDMHLPSSGLAIYHCDTKGSNEFQQGTREKHYQCALLQADGHLDLEQALNQGDGGDLYTRVEGTAVSHSSVPASRRWDGAESGLTITDISEPGAKMTFRIGEVVEGGKLLTGQSTPAASIPDNRPGGVNDVITLQGEGTVRSIKVSLTVTHTYVGDLRVVLLSPTGRRAILHNRSGGNAENLVLELDSEPPSTLAPLVGQPVAGDWRLSVSDNAMVDTGTLDRWSIEIRTGT
jgi:M6 family metalloprotease-like protein